MDRQHSFAMVQITHPKTGLPTGFAVDLAKVPEGLPGFALTQIDDARREREAAHAALENDLMDAVKKRAANGDYEVDGDGVHLWRAFWSMDLFRQMGPMGMQPLAPTDMRAWADMTGQHFTAAEWRTLFHMDAAFRAAAGDPEKGERPDLTPAIFDAMFD